jgi:hypothetical protein
VHRLQGASFVVALDSGGYPDDMSKSNTFGHAGLVGWRKAIADRVAPPAARRGPFSEEQARAAIGTAFFLLSLYYVGSTIARIVRSGRS